MVSASFCALRTRWPGDENKWTQQILLKKLWEDQQMSWEATSLNRISHEKFTTRLETVVLNKTEEKRLKTRAMSLVLPEKKVAKWRLFCGMKNIFTGLYTDTLFSSHLIMPHPFSYDSGLCSATYPLFSCWYLKLYDHEVLFIVLLLQGIALLSVEC